MVWFERLHTEHIASLGLLAKAVSTPRALRPSEWQQPQRGFKKCPERQTLRYDRTIASATRRLNAVTDALRVTDSIVTRSIMPVSKFSASTRLRIGVLFAPPPVQLLDVAPVDLFFMLSKEYLDGIPIMPGPIKALALQRVDIFYITDNGEPAMTTHKLANPASNLEQDIKLAPLTAHLNVLVPQSITGYDVQPGQLDILMIPGPDPSTVPSQACRKFMQAHANSGRTDIISICTGIYPLCYSNVCDGHTVTGPRGLLSDLRSKFQDVKVFEDRRWSKDTLTSVSEAASTAKNLVPSRPAELWTAAGLTNGHDCIAAYIKEHFNQDLAEVVCRMADVGDRRREYETGQMTEGMWWVSRILRAAIRGILRS